MKNVNYAEFGRRFFARIINSLLLVVAAFVLALIAPQYLMRLETEKEINNLIFVAVDLVVTAYFHSSRLQATPGKIVMGIYVTDLNGERISFLRAFGREIAGILSFITLFIGFLMMVFTSRKQTLHDIIAKTVVLEGKPEKAKMESDPFFKDTKMTTINRKMTTVVSSPTIESADRGLDFYGGSSSKPSMGEPPAPPVKKPPTDQQW